MLHRLLLVCLLACTVIVGADPTQTALSVRGSPFPLMSDPALDGFGLNTGFYDGTNGAMTMVATAGFRMVRADLAWKYSEYTKGQYYFDKFDRILKAAEENGMRVLFILGDRNNNYDNGDSPHTDEGRTAFANWAAATVEHFKGHGILWEIYNEPNNALFWKPTPNTDDYIKVAQVACEAIQKVSPNEIMIGPAPAGGIRWSATFVENCFKGGLLKYFSAVTVHPYRNNDPETVAAEYRKLRVMIDRYAPPGKVIPIYSGEWGYSSVGTNGTLPNDERTQARNNIRLTLTNWCCDVPLSVWYEFSNSSYGIVRNNSVQGQQPAFFTKRAYDAAQVMTSQIKGLRFSKRLWTGDQDVYLMLFTGNQDYRLVTWTTSSQPKEVTLPAGQWNGVDLFGQNLPSIVGNKLVLQQDPVYLSVGGGDTSTLALLETWERLPASLIVSVPQVIEVITRFVNPLTTSINVNQHQLAPGESMKITTSVTMKADDVEVPVDLTIDIQGGGTWTQRTWINVRSKSTVPLANVVPTIPALHLNTTNGVATNGTITAIDPDGPSLSFALATQPSQGQVTSFNTSTGAFVYLPNNNAIGTDMFTVIASDFLSVSAPGTVTISIQATPPVISTVPNQSINANMAMQSLPFSVSDPRISASALVVTATMSGNSVVDQSGLVLSGSGTQRFITLTPKLNASGTVLVTLTVSNGLKTASSSFTATFNVIPLLPVAITITIPLFDAISHTQPPPVITTNPSGIASITTYTDLATNVVSQSIPIEPGQYLVTTTIHAAGYQGSSQASMTIPGAVVAPVPNESDHQLANNDKKCGLGGVTALIAIGALLTAIRIRQHSSTRHVASAADDLRRTRTKADKKPDDPRS